MINLKKNFFRNFFSFKYLIYIIICLIFSKNQDIKTQKDYIINKIDLIRFGFQRRNSFSFIQNTFPMKIDNNNNKIKKQESILIKKNIDLVFLQKIHKLKKEKNNPDGNFKDKEKDIKKNHFNNINKLEDVNLLKKFEIKKEKEKDLKLKIELKLEGN
jgi:hypothetical protein